MMTSLGTVVCEQGRASQEHFGLDVDPRYLILGWRCKHRLGSRLLVKGLKRHTLDLNVIWEQNHCQNRNPHPLNSQKPKRGVLANKIMKVNI